MVFPVIIILRSRYFLTEKNAGKYKYLFWSSRLPRWSRICGKCNTFFERKSLLNDNLFNSVYLYLELPEKVLLRRESLSIYNDFVLISAHSRAW